MTLIIIKRRKHRTNGHVLMAYLAVTDVVLLSLMPFLRFLLAPGVSFEESTFFAELCIFREFVSWIGTYACLFSYLVLSIDR